MKIFFSMPKVKRPYIKGVDELPIGYINKATDKADVDAFAKASLGQQYACIDYEALPVAGWPITPESTALWNANAARYKELLQGYKTLNLNTKVGYYGVVPVNDAGGQLSPNLSQFMAGNDRVQPVADLCDVFFPELYAFANRPFEQWLIMSAAKLREVRRLAKGKPVYPYVWYKYVDNGEAYVPPELFGRMLDFCSAWADGFVVWGFDAWDENAHWLAKVREHL